MPKHNKDIRHGGSRPKRSTGLTTPWIVLAVVLVIAAVILLLPRGGLPAAVDVVRAHALYTGGAMMLDVRTSAEFEQQHIPGSVLIPLDDLTGRMGELPKDKDIVVVCRSGNRSREGTTILRDAGFQRVTCMTGGLQAWAAAGYPTEP
ncbi:MAG TPA: rhodanese-like domain-containing protein [Anaerolineales bacterium]|nr:rhodanese-like domain-containing protein [Anaerolineales bacterium]